MPCRDVRAGTHIEKVNAEPSAKWLLNEAAMKRPRCVSSRSTVSWWGSHPNRASGCSPKKVDLCVLSWVVVVVVVVEEKEWARAGRGEGTVVAAATATARRDTWDTCGLNRSISIDGRAAWLHTNRVSVSWSRAGVFPLDREGVRWRQWSSNKRQMFQIQFGFVLNHTAFLQRHQIMRHQLIQPHLSVVDFSSVPRAGDEGTGGHHGCFHSGRNETVGWAQREVAATKRGCAWANCPSSSGFKRGHH